MKEIDMSSEAITRRLLQASELRDLGNALKKSRPISPEEAAELRKRNKAKRTEGQPK